MSLFDRVKSKFSDSENPEIWNNISGLEEVETILQQSKERPQLIYKHSHRCSVCVLAKEELEKISEQVSDIAELYMINVIHQRALSNTIASELDVRHESPQVILLEDGEVLWKGSHWDLKGDKILEELT